MPESTPTNLKFTFRKSERLNSKKLIEELFEKGSSFYLYPFKVIHLESTVAATNQVLISVPKRKFKGAVTRNLIKRRIREAYRLNKHQLESVNGLLIAFVYTGKEVLWSTVIHKAMIKALRQIESVYSS